jgi:hypothetical protein
MMTLLRFIKLVIVEIFILISFSLIMPHFRQAIALFSIKIKSDRLYEINYNEIAPYPIIKSDRPLPTR